MRGLQTLVFSVTNRCPARCQDCPIVYEEGPRHTLTVEEMIRIFDEVISWGTLKLVVFTGGEPFLLGDELRKIVAYVSSHNIFTRIVTNAYWATSNAVARRILEDFKEAGLTEINVSCDDYHQEFIPLEYIKYANEAACDVGLPLLLAHRQKPGGRITMEYLSRYFGVDLKEFQIGKENPKNNVILSGMNIPIKTHVESQDEAESEICKTEKPWIGPCPSVLGEIIISSNKRVQICCGIASSSIKELYIGSLEEESLLSILKKGNNDLIANWLALEGPSSILEFVLSKDPTIDLPERYVNRCHLCNELFTRDEVRDVLHKHASERGEMLALMRGILEWIAEDWAREARNKQL